MGSDQGHPISPTYIFLAYYKTADGTNGQSEYRFDTALHGHEITKIYRLVFYRLRPSKTPIPLCVIDVAGGGVTLTFADQAKTTISQIKLSAKILCALALNSSGYINLEVEYKADPELPRCTKFEIAGKPLGGNSTDRLQKAIDDGSPIPLGFQNVESTSLKNCTGFEILTTTRLNTIAGNMNCHLATSRTIRLVKRADSDYYQLWFEVTETTTGECSLPIRQLKLWNNQLSDVARDQAPRTWRFIQRPATDMDAGLGSTGGQKWILHVFGIPTYFVLREWERWADEYRRSLRQVVGHKPVTFLPRFHDFQNSTSVPVYPGRWVLSYLLRPSNDSGSLCTPLSIHLIDAGSADHKLELQASLLGIRDLSNHPVDGRAIKLVPTIDESNQQLRAAEYVSGIALNCDGPIAGGSAASGSVVRMGSLDLEFSGAATDEDAKSKLRLPGWIIVRPQGDITDVHVDLHFRISDLYPGGQDDPAGEEFVPERLNNLGALDPCSIVTASTNTDDIARREQDIEAGFRRKSPLIIDLSRANVPAKPALPFLLRVMEDFQTGYNQVVRLNIISNSPATQIETKARDVCSDNNGRDVLVLDTNPFLVAKVHYLPFDQVGRFNSTTIAEWSSGDSDAANWKLQFNQEPFCLTLPPAGVGEEMIKSNSYSTTFPIPFRFSPPTRLVLDPRTAPTQFAEAPWNLRRILGTPGQPFPGPLVKSLQYELLYGLSCDAEQPMVRLAEIFARIGKIAARRNPEIEWPATKGQRAAYVRERQEWSQLYRQYLSRIAVLEPWNSILPSVDEKPIALMEGVTCWVRPYPDSDMQDPFNPSAGTLRGGATWGFESRNIYQTVFDNPEAGAAAASRKPAPSSSASVADLELSSLGGWGHQVAGFQGGLTKIYSDSSMGRTYRYKLERLGRIAVFWNLAKHVIVYERTVAPPKQFLTEEPQLPGWPLLRKVREYVEILEDVRTYPDNPTFANSADQQLAERARGPIASCTFLKGAQISVSGAWGGDVGQIGWRVPLWNPSTGNSSVYPKPKITLGIFSTVNEKPQVCPSEIDHPENVYFFTQTRDIVDGKFTDKVDPDPHRWSAVSGVDFVNLERPVAPRGNFEAGDLRQIVPNEAPVPGGYGPCTFQLVPAPVPANLVQDRGAPQPMSAVLETVSMSRSASGADKLPADIVSLQTVHSSTVAIFSEILKSIPSDAITVNSSISTAIKNAKDSQLSVLQDTLSKGKQQLTVVQTKFGADLQKIENLAADNLRNQLVEPILSPLTGKGLLDEFQSNANDILQNFDRAKAQAAVAQLQASIDEALLLVQSLPGAIGQFVAKYFDAANQISLNVDKELSVLRSEMQDFTQIRAQSAVDSFVAGFRSRFVTPLLNAGSGRPTEQIPDLTAYARKYLRDLMTGFDLAAQTMRVRVKTATKADDIVAIFKDSDFYKACTTYTVTAGGRSKLPDVIVNFATAVLKLTTSFSGSMADLDAKLKLGEVWKNSLIAEWDAKVAKWDSSNAAKFKSTIDEATKFLKDDMPARVDKLKTDVQSQISHIAQVFADEFDSSFEQLNNVGKKLEDTLAKLTNASVAQAREELQKMRDDYSQQAQALVDKGVRSLLPDKTILQTGSQTLSLVRALGQPPKVPQLEFDREKIAYYFSEVAPSLDITPVLARVHQASEVLAQGQQILDALKPLGMSVPVTGIFDQLLPAKLENFDLSSVLPNVAGLQLDKLFSGLKFPKNLGGDKVRVTHGLDQQSRRPYVRGDVDVQTTELATVFTIGPVCLQVVTAHFQASTFVDVGIDGTVRRKVSGKISGQWRLAVSNQTVVTLKKTTLSFDDSGQIKFAVSPTDIELPGAMAFISELAKAYKGKDSGLSIGLLPDGFQSVLKLPIPNTQAGTSGISNLTIGALFSVRFTEGQFQLSVGFSLARPDAPFSLTIFILGGGGYLEALATYSPNTGQIGCEVSLSVTASASLAISLGPISGGVYVYLGMTGHFATGGPGLTLGMIVLIRGEVNVLGIVSAAVSLLLEATYNSQSGELAGHGQLSISIKICWCFTLEINEEVHYTLGKNSDDKVSLLDRPAANLVAALPGADSAFAYALAADANDDFLKYAKQYVAMLT
jgi:hypothetical protein